MKTPLRILTLVGMQVVMVLLLARLVRGDFVSGLKWDIHVCAAVAYGLPAALTLIGCLSWIRPSRSRMTARVLNFALAVVVTVLALGLGVLVLQSADQWLVARYIQRTQPQLKADPRFKDVGLICYSNDYVLKPYIPVGGSVANEEDLRELNRFFKAMHPPANVYAGIWLVRRQPLEDQAATGR